MMGILDPEQPLSQIEHYLGHALATTPAEETLVALDFDQTLSLTSVVEGEKVYALRGGEESSAWLASLTLRGIDSIVVTAAPASTGSANAVRGDMGRIGVGHLFPCNTHNDGDVEALLEALTRWEDGQEGGDDERVRKSVRLMLAFILLSQRKGSDLYRVGRSHVRWERGEERERIVFDLAAPDGSTWSATQVMDRSEEVGSLYARVWDVLDPIGSLCVMLESDEGGEGGEGGERGEPEEGDRLFVREDGSVFESAGDLIGWLREVFLVPAGLMEEGSLSDTALASLFWSESVLLSTPDKIAVAKSGQLLCARYNKPEAVEAYIKAWRYPHPLTQGVPPSVPDEGGRPPVSTIIFVDDNSDNVVKMFLHFAAKRAAHLVGDDGFDPVRCPRVISLHYPPPVGGVGEVVDLGYLGVLEYLSQAKASEASAASAASAAASEASSVIP